MVDSASIEVNRRERRQKTDRLDVEKLVKMLIRWKHGEKGVWAVARVPSAEEEDARRPHREMERLVRERTGHVTRMKALLALSGGWDGNPARVDVSTLKDWRGNVLPAYIQEELLREQRRLVLVEEQMDAIVAAIEERIDHPVTEADRQAQKLLKLKGVGPAEFSPTCP